MRDRHDDLRSLADDIKADANRVHDIEDETTQEDPRSARFRDLSAESERITRGMAVKASAQRELADELRDEGDAAPYDRSGRTRSPAASETASTT